MPNFIEIGVGSRKFSKKLVDLTRNDPEGKRSMLASMPSVKETQKMLVGGDMYCEEGKFKA